MDSLGDRMKGYESVTKTKLMPRTPVLIRLDGKAFHTLTKHLDKPYCRKFNKCMWHTAEYLCKNIQGCQLAYVQSDEITLLLIDYQNFDTQGWFDYQVQKMVSVSASMASAAFNYEYNVNKFPGGDYVFASFDARAWNVPKEEVSNAFLWRQQDATRNSIQSAGQHYFSHKELHGKSCDEIQEMLFQTHGINWNDYSIPQKRGICVIKNSKKFNVNCPEEKNGCLALHTTTRTQWEVDESIPIFSQDRNYIEKFVYL